MAKKSNNFCQGKDSFERINFLYQAGHLMAANPVLSCYYGQMCKTIAKKSVLRLDPNIKRTICKRCGRFLKPGVSADLSEVQECNRSVVLLTCHKCSFIKRFIINDNYKLWLDEPASIKETVHIEATPKKSSAGVVNNVKEKVNELEEQKWN